MISWRLNSTLNLVLFSDESLDEEEEEGSGSFTPILNWCYFQMRAWIRGAECWEDTSVDQLEAEHHSLSSAILR
jgi:hypothetical protein